MTTEVALYELTDDLLEAGAQLTEYLELPEEEQTAEAQGELLKSWKGVKLKFEVKVEACALYMLAKQAHADIIRAEIARLQGMLGTVEKSHKWLARYVKDEMVAAAAPRVDGQRVRIRRQANPKKAEIAPEAPEDAREYLPEGQVRTIPEKNEPDKRAILAWHKEHPKEKLPEHVTITQVERLVIW